MLGCEVLRQISWLSAALFRLKALPLRVRLFVPWLLGQGATWLARGEIRRFLGSKLCCFVAIAFAEDSRGSWQAIGFSATLVVGELTLIQALYRGCFLLRFGFLALERGSLVARVWLGDGSLRLHSPARPGPRGVRKGDKSLTTHKDQSLYFNRYASVHKCT